MPKEISPQQQKNRVELSHVVEETQGNSKEHMDDAEDHRHLHLEGVEEGQLVAGNVPDLYTR